MRTLKEQVIDKLLLMYIITRTNEIASRISGKLKLQKLCFLGEWELMKSEMNGLNFRFFRFNFGPFSKSLYEDYEFLASKKRLFENIYTLTHSGKILLDSFLDSTKVIGNNKDFFKILNRIIRKWGHFSGKQLMNRVYEMEIIPYEIPGVKMKIKDIPTFYDILVPAQNDDFDRKFDLSDELLDDFTYCLNLDLQSRIRMRMSSNESYKDHFG